MNPSDPLAKLAPSGRELFDRASKLVDGAGYDDILNVGGSLIVNTLRQQHDNRRSAEQHFDEILARAKTKLMECYDSTGRKKGIFPYHQNIVVPLIKPR